jgi:hypothetical protein
MLALDVVLKETPSRWWDAHRKEMKEWAHCSRLMQIHFGPEEEEYAHKYIGESNLTGHLEIYRALWCAVLKIEWKHRFIHTLDTNPKNWYLELEMRREITSWEEMVWIFEVMFTFEHESPSIHTTLHAIRINIFSEVEMMEVVPFCSAHKAKMIVKKLLEFYNVTKEEYENEDPKNVQIHEIEGTCIVERLELASTMYTQPIKMKTVNIGTMESPKFA